MIKINIVFLIIILYLFPFSASKAANQEQLFCKGIYWSNKEAQYAEWKVIKRVSVHKIHFKINDLKKIAKVSFRKGNAGIVIGIGGWQNRTEEKSSLSFTYSLTNKLFKMKSRYSDIKIEGKCKGKIYL
ncbi:MAG: hypothetical protein CFH33_00078 [Alphaproteobacteria bacterium MarineAlpha9_Bin3]|nr:MAG: hypothetical protein CFH33_00078 [Alphaproteobacteria bacterium MarineAlpha9_Bin3]|tara:strand:+ start:1257 stop:1643 length:387 start_codon:yes stop_codon:yes gene_type:complete